MKNIYYIEANQSFFDCLISGITSRFGDSNLDDLIILLPSRRACRDLRTSFLKYFNNKPHIPPQILAIGDFDEEQISLSSLIESSEVNLPNPAFATIELQILLAKLIQKHHELGMVQSLSLAYDLSLFLNELEKEHISPDRLQELVVDDFAIHWQQILDFLLILAKYLPQKMQELGKVTKTSYRNQLIALQNSLWADNPPDKKIIAAGSSGTNLSTASLLKTVASLENGMVILPSLDKDLDVGSWNLIDEFHPQYNLKKLLNYIGADRSFVTLWASGHYFCDEMRRKFISQSMRSSSSCDKWAQINSIEESSIRDINYIIADNPQHEATIISLILRSTLETPGKTASLITNDRNLASRVISILDKFGITLNDSAGNKLSDTPSMVFLRLVANMVTNNFTAVDLLSLFKHSLSSVPVEFVAEIELLILRGTRITPGLSSLITSLKLLDRADLSKILAEILPANDAFIELMNQPLANFKQLLIAHIKLSESIAKNIDSNSILWKGDIGLEIISFLQNLLLYTEELNPIKPSDYLAILDNFLISAVYRPKYGTHPRLSILSPIEARFYHHDLIIMASLNEDDWPASVSAGPWINNSMRKTLGLSPLQRHVGQMAHDFYSLFCAREVYLTRSSKSGGTANIASRWLLRIETLLRKFDISIRNDYWASIAKLIHKPTSLMPISCPAPKPASIFRPTRLSVTEIEKLMRDPYWIYARKILNLKKLEDVDADLSAADFGNFIHQALDHFSMYFKTTSKESWHELLLDSGRHVLQNMLDRPVIKSLWWPRFERIASWIVNREIDNISSNKIFTEIRGKIIIDGFELIAKADRLEIDPSDHIILIDYKTGTLPTLTSIKKGISSQMILEALIACGKGFTTQNPLTHYESSKIIYIRLTGGEIAGEELIIDKDIAELLEEASVGVSNLIRAFSDSNTAYLPSPLPDRILQFNDYDHLARTKEWS